MSALNKNTLLSAASPEVSRFLTSWLCHLIPLHEGPPLRGNYPWWSSPPKQPPSKASHHSSADTAAWQEVWFSLILQKDAGSGWTEFKIWKLWSVRLISLLRVSKSPELSWLMLLGCVCLHALTRGAGISRTKCACSSNLWKWCRRTRWWRAKEREKEYTELSPLG